MIMISLIKNATEEGMDERIQAAMNEVGMANVIRNILFFFLEFLSNVYF